MINGIPVYFANSEIWSSEDEDYWLWKKFKSQ